MSEITPTEKKSNGKNGNRKNGQRKIGQPENSANFPVAQFSRSPIFRCRFFPLPFLPLPVFLPRIHLAVTSDIGNYRLRSSVLHGAVDTVALSPSVYLSVRSPDRYFSALYWAQTLKTLAVASPDYRASK